VARIELDIRTDARPEANRAALLDFSERRPELWPGLPPARGVAIRRSIEAGPARVCLGPNSW